MSTEKRKITYWSIDFIEGERHFFDGELLCRFFAYIANLDEKRRIETMPKTNKAISLESVRDFTIQGFHLLEIVFKSCKFNHSPAYMSSLDGTERPSTKHLDEGEKELTHICMRIDSAEAYTVFEDRRNGIAMGTMIRYLNRFLKQFFSIEEKEDNSLLWASIIPSEDFLTSLETTKKISSVELFVENTVLGSDYLNLIGMDANFQKDIVMTIKSKPRQSLGKEFIKQAFLRLSTEGYKASRIRIRGKDINKMSVTIDSLNGKKVDEISVNLLESGVVDTHSIFTKLEEILGVSE